MSFRERTTALSILALWTLTTAGWWGFAFAPIPVVSQDWLEAARVACFGQMESGLPDASGWILLVLAPLSFLIAIAFAWGHHVGESLQWLARLPAGRALLLAVGLAFGWHINWVGEKIYQGQKLAKISYENLSGEDLPENYAILDKPAPRFELIDQNGAPQSLDGLRGRTLIVTFAFAHCKTICPAIVAQSTRILRDLDPDSTRLLIITLDPWRDTPRALASMAAKWNLPPSAHVLSGEIKKVTDTLTAFNVPWQRDEKTGDIAHPSLTYVIQPNGRIAYGFSNAPMTWIIQGAKRVQNLFAQK